MDIVICLVIGVFFAASLRMMLSRRLVRIVIGVSVLTNAVNLFILTAGRLTAGRPPVLSAASGEGAIANPLPQALILTAIVISFAVFAFLLVLIARAFAGEESDDAETLRLAEPRQGEPPFVDY